jgi:hypothetical protein
VCFPPFSLPPTTKEPMGKQPQLIGEATSEGCMVMAGNDTVFLTRHYEEHGHPVMDVIRIPLSDVREVTKLLNEAGTTIEREQQAKWQELAAKGEVF